MLTVLLTGKWQSLGLRQMCVPQNRAYYHFTVLSPALFDLLLRWGSTFN